MTIRVLTGVTTTGTLHLGNYVGAIRPAIQKSLVPDTQSYFFMADYHALIKCDDPARIERSRVQIASTWLACGLDPERVHFYRQSDIPEIPELSWILTCITSKGQMNRAHAYKAKVDANLAAGEEPDVNITMGLYCYPILMAADILMFNANLVPVGKDQIQHIEMCRDVATRFNVLHGKGKEIFTLPEALVDPQMELLPGLDGRKMSKSYDNVVPLFEGGEKALQNAISRIVTDAKLPGEMKDPDSTALTAIFEAFATPEERADFRNKLKTGLGWGEAKALVFKQVNNEIAPKRAKYDELMLHPEQVEEILQEGARKVRLEARALLDEVRFAVGLRTFKNIEQKQKISSKKLENKPVLKQYREKDGLFYFKLLDATAKLLLTAGGLSSGKETGALVARFRTEGLSALVGSHCELADGVAEAQIVEALKILSSE